MKQYQIACLLHDLGRAGLDRHLFGRIWSWARAHGIPTRPREWRALHPDTRYGRETEAFVARYRAAMDDAGITLDSWACEQVEMRLGYARRLAARFADGEAALRELGVAWAPWMGRVMLYYYYPENWKAHSPGCANWRKCLSPVSNSRPTAINAGSRLLCASTRRPVGGLCLSADVATGTNSEPSGCAGLRELAAEGVFDGVLAQARAALTARERAFCGAPRRSNSMAVKSLLLRVAMQGDCQVENITDRLRAALEETHLRAGILTVFIRHTTASVLIIEDEPGIRADTKAIWERLIPADPTWQHNERNAGEDNGHSHLRGQLQDTPHDSVQRRNDGAGNLAAGSGVGFRYTRTDQGRGPANHW